MLLLFKMLQTTNEVAELVVKYIVVTAYDEPVFYCFGWNGRGGEGYITQQVQSRGGLVFLSPVLTNFSVSSALIKQIKAQNITLGPYTITYHIRTHRYVPIQKENWRQA